MAQTCSNSACAAPGTKSCGGCNQVYYCSSACQKLDWRSHKAICKRIPASPAAKALPYQCSTFGCAGRPALRCSLCNDATYCSKLCRIADLEAHKLSCPDATGTSGVRLCVKATMIHSRAEGGRYSRTLALYSDPIFSTSPVPISVKIGLPLLVQRADPTCRGGPMQDNQHGTWLMIDPVTGLAPAEWQGGIGNVIVARADGEALDTPMLAAITDYVSDILDAFGKGVGAAQKYYNRGRLDNFIADHQKMQEQYKALQEEIARGENPEVTG